MPELVMIFIVLLLLAVPALVALGLIWFFALRKKPNPIPQIPQGLPNTTDRLAELDALRARNVITESEHEEKRRKILDEL